MVQIFNPRPANQQQQIKLAELTDKIKSIFKPGTMVKAQVVKSQADQVILNVNNHVFQVKSEVPLKSGTWIKGQVHVEQDGQTYLKLLESPEEIELRQKTNQFMQKYQNSVDHTALNKDIVRTILAMDKTPTPKLVNDLASYFRSHVEHFSHLPDAAFSQEMGPGIAGQGPFTTEFLQEIVFLFLHRLPVNQDTIQMAARLLEVGQQIDLANDPWGEIFLVPEPHAANPENPASIDTSVVRATLQQLFKMFFAPGGQSTKTGEPSWLGRQYFNENESLSRKAGTSSNKNTQPGLLDLLGLGRAINAVKHHQDASSLSPASLWGFFWLEMGQSSVPGEFYLSKLSRDGRNKGYFQERTMDEGFTLGISLNPENLGPLVVRMHLRENVLSLQFISHHQGTAAILSEHEEFLRQRLKYSGLTIARLENRQANIEDKRIQTRIARTPLTPKGSLDTRV